MQTKHWLHTVGSIIARRFVRLATNLFRWIQERRPLHSDLSADEASPPPPNNDTRILSVTAVLHRVLTTTAFGILGFSLFIDPSLPATIKSAKCQKDLAQKAICSEGYRQKLNKTLHLYGQLLTREIECVVANYLSRATTEEPPNTNSEGLRKEINKALPGACTSLPQSTSQPLLTLVGDFVKSPNDASCDDRELDSLVQTDRRFQTRTIEIVEFTTELGQILRSLDLKFQEDIRELQVEIRHRPAERQDEVRVVLKSKTAMLLLPHLTTRLALIGAPRGNDSLVATPKDDTIIMTRYYTASSEFPNITPAEKRVPLDSLTQDVFVASPKTNDHCAHDHCAHVDEYNEYNRLQELRLLESCGCNPETAADMSSVDTSSWTDHDKRLGVRAASCLSQSENELFNEMRYNGTTLRGSGPYIQEKERQNLSLSTMIGAIPLSELVLLWATMVVLGQSLLFFVFVGEILVRIQQHRLTLRAIAAYPWIAMIPQGLARIAFSVTCAVPILCTFQLAYLQFRVSSLGGWMGRFTVTGSLLCCLFMLRAYFLMDRIRRGARTMGDHESISINR